MTYDQPYNQGRATVILSIAPVPRFMYLVLLYVKGTKRYYNIVPPITLHLGTYKYARFIVMFSTFHLCAVRIVAVLFLIRVSSE